MWRFVSEGGRKDGEAIVMLILRKFTNYVNLWSNNGELNCKLYYCTGGHVRRARKLIGATNPRASFVRYKLQVSCGRGSDDDHLMCNHSNRKPLGSG